MKKDPATTSVPKSSVSKSAQRLGAVGASLAVAGLTAPADAVPITSPRNETAFWNDREEAGSFENAFENADGTPRTAISLTEDGGGTLPFSGPSIDVNGDGTLDIVVSANGQDVYIRKLAQPAGQPSGVDTIEVHASSNDNVFAYGVGDIIGSSASLGSGTLFLAQEVDRTTGLGNGAFFNSDGVAALGFTLIEGVDRRFGYVTLDVTVDTATARGAVTIMDIVVESELNTPITVVPEPQSAALAGLVAGAAGLAGRRRERDPEAA